MVISQRNINYSRTIASIKTLLCARHSSRPLMRILFYLHNPCVYSEVQLLSSFSDEKTKAQRKTTKLRYLIKCGIYWNPSSSRMSLGSLPPHSPSLIKMQLWLGLGRFFLRWWCSLLLMNSLNNIKQKFGCQSTILMIIKSVINIWLRDTISDW